MFEYFYKKLETSDFSTALKIILEIGLKIGHSLIIIAISMIIYTVLKKIIKKSFAKAGTKYPKKNYEATCNVLTSIVRYIIYFFIGFNILKIFGVPIESLLAVTGVGGIALAFGAKNLVEDCITGITILMENQFSVGDNITVDGKSGTVESLDIRTTRLRNADGDMHIIPNRLIKGVTNMSKEYNRAVIDISVSYSENIEKIFDILTTVIESSCQGLDGLISKPSILGITEMGDTCLIIRVAADCQIDKNWGIEREIRKIIKLRFEKEGVKPPYPHQIASE